MDPPDGYAPSLSRSKQDLLLLQQGGIKFGAMR